MQKKQSLTKEEKEKILVCLKNTYGDATCALDYQTPFELLVAVMLSAQCTDKRVNVVTEILFEKYNTCDDIIELGEIKLQEYIRSCGLSQTKSKNIVATARKIRDEFDGKVPQEIEVLKTLPGVGQKTANVVASEAFGVPAIAVDTHVFRVANRLGLAHATNVINTEKQLQECIPKDEWSSAHHWLIWHGRTVCTARNPKCSECVLQSFCLYNRTHDEER